LDRAKLALVPETPRTKLANSFTGVQIDTPPSPSPGRSNPRPRGGGPPPTGRIRRVMTPLDDTKKAILRANIAAKVQQPATPEGREKWKDELREWGARHGSGALNETTIVPLQPGTLAVCSGECFRCGGQGHGRGAVCSSPTAIPNIEKDWRMYCQRELGCTRVAGVNAVQVGSDSIFEGMVESGNGEGSEI
jgi:hypothetical protein